MSDLKRIDQKLDKIDEAVSRIDVTLAVNTEVLKEHTKRSDRLEAIVLPLQKKVNYVEGALKALGIVAMLAGIIEVVLMAIK